MTRRRVRGFPAARFSRRIAGAGAGLCLLIAGLAASPARADPVAPPDSVVAAPPDTTQSDDEQLGEYLGELSLETDDTFLLDELSISDAEVDSLIRAWESGEDVGERNPDVPSGWRREFTIGGVRYNRVEGLNLMGDASITTPTSPRATAFGRLGYGWAAEEPTWRGGLRVAFDRVPAAPTLEVAHFRDVFSYGAGGVPGNSLFALTVGRDHDDYFRGEGLSAGVALAPGPFRVAATYVNEEQESLPNETDFTIFDEGQEFRLNPPIDDGDSRRMQFSLGVGDPARGALAAELRGAFAGRGLGGDFEYETMSGKIVARRPLWFGDELRTKLWGGRVTGEAPRQALPFVGGTQRLRGYAINEIPARTAVAASLDYTLGTNPLRYVPYLWRFRIQPVPFFDAAGIFETQDALGTVIDLDDPEWLFSAGLGLQYNVLGIPGGTGQARLDIARRLDRGDDAWTYRLGITVER